MFKGKSYKELSTLKKSITKKLNEGKRFVNHFKFSDLHLLDIDVGYWEALLSLLTAYLARARLRERHQELLKQKLMKLKEEQMNEKEEATCLPQIIQVCAIIYIFIFLSFSL